VPLPDAEQQKLALSDFDIAVNRDTSTYDLKMHVKNGTDGWCVTSLGILYTFGDARGQEWVANEYPAVKKFSLVRETPQQAKTAAARGAAPAAGANPARANGTAGANAAPASASHSAGLSPGQDEQRTMFDVYFYIQPRPLELFDGFHLISAQIKSSLGYLLNKQS